MSDDINIAVSQTAPKINMSVEDIQQMSVSVNTLPQMGIAMTMGIVHIKGDKGDPGIPGADGLSAYEMSRQNGFTGTESEWLLSLKGEHGEQGLSGTNGEQGPPGADGLPGKDGKDGKDGEDGDTPIKGEDYFDGQDGVDGINGADGIDATITIGTVTTGAAGTSASVSNVGTPSDAVFNFKIPKGDKGEKGDNGQDGYTPIKGEDYFDGKDGADGKDGVDGQNGTPGADGNDGIDGLPGQDGVDAFVYVAYASTNSGTDFSLTPTDSLKYRAEIHVDTEIVSPQSSDFTGAVWVKYIGDDGQDGADGADATVYDGLDSESTTEALSANQGCILNSSISDIANKLPSGKITVSATEPVSPQEGDLWFKILSIASDPPVTDYYFRFDASKLSLADNAKISIWEDLSENNNDVIQANSTYQPIYKATGLNNKPAIYFDGTTYLNKELFTLPNLNAITIFAVYKLNSIGSMTIADIGSDEVSAVILRSSSGGLSQLQINEEGIAEFSTVTVPVLTMGVYDKTNNTLYKNGIQANNVAYTSSIVAHDNLRLGKSFYGGGIGVEGMVGYLSEIIVYPRNLNAAEITSMSEYGLAKWAIL